MLQPAELAFHGGAATVERAVAVSVPGNQGAQAVGLIHTDEGLQAPCQQQQSVPVSERPKRSLTIQDRAEVHTPSSVQLGSHQPQVLVSPFVP